MLTFLQATEILIFSYLPCAPGLSLWFLLLLLRFRSAGPPADLPEGEAGGRTDSNCLLGNQEGRNGASQREV